MPAFHLRIEVRGLALFALLALLALPAGAQVARTGGSELDALARVSQRLAVAPDFRPVATAGDALAPGVAAALEAYRTVAGGTWSAHVDARRGFLGDLIGSGRPWIPGSGNALTNADIDELLAGRAEPDLAVLDRRARREAAALAGLLGVDPAALRLNPERSGNPTPHVWFVDYDVLAGGHVVDGARVVFTVNGGNLVAVETENLPSPDARVPETKVAVEQAWAGLGAHLGGFLPGDEVIDAGSYHLLPANRLRPAAGGGLEPGPGRDLAGVWQFVFVREGVVGTWRARVDAETGRVEEFTDINTYGKVTGGVRKSDSLPADTVVPLPFANYGTSLYANSAGLFGGTTGTTTLNGQYVRIVDTCGAISKAADAAGTIAMGSSSGTNCQTPGTGGAGNTRATRTQFYHLNRAKEMGRGWLPSNSWLSAKLTANVNINQACNAYWDGSAVNFFRSGSVGGTSCANTGEIPGVSLHEWAHGLDENDGRAPSSEYGTGETYGDWAAATVTHASCVGAGFLTANCGGYGNACTSCSGVRDIDWARHAANTPSTVANFTYPTCPLTNWVGAPDTYVGPCGLDRLARGFYGEEGHCESQVSSEPLWDLVARDLASLGARHAWTIADRLWFLSRSTAGKAFQCNTSVTPYTSNGCLSGSAFRVLRALDDDNGNLADGTPHGGAIAAAFNRHGIACTSDAGWNTTRVAVAPPAVPVLSGTPGNNQANLSWSGSSGVYDVFRNETSCNAGFTRIANDFTATAGYDPNVANGVTYYYQVTAQPAGNESASSAPSNCVSVTPSSVVPPGPCVPSATKLCLNQSRYHVTVAWRDYQNNTGVGTAIPWTTDSGLFWFFSANNIEFLVKVLNGCSINNRVWVYAAATTDVEYTLTVQDSVTGALKTYYNPLGTASPAITDSAAFSTCGTAAPPPPAEGLEAFGLVPLAEVELAERPEVTRLENLLAVAEAAGRVPEAAMAEAATVPPAAEALPGAESPAACTPSNTALCLNQSRFRVTVTWRDYQNNTGAGTAVPIPGNADSGLFWFFSANNIEMLIKVLNACGINNRYWVYAAATTDVEYTLTVTDTNNGAVKSYFNPLGTASPAITDSAAFATCP